LIDPVFVGVVVRHRKEVIGYVQIVDFIELLGQPLNYLGRPDRNGTDDFLGMNPLQVVKGGVKR
jgi:hypothetical protein